MRLLIFFLLLRFATAATYFVSPNGNDASRGTLHAPFRTIAHALKRASCPGDKIYLQRGVYKERIRSFFSGKKGRPIQIIGEAGVEVHFSGRPLKINHNHINIRNIIFDGEWAQKPVASIHGNYVQLRNCEFKNSKRDIITLGNVRGVVIDSCRIHHGFSWWKRTHKEPHGISAKGVKDLKIRHCKIYQITGDCIQISPSRDDWDRVLIEDCDFSATPISAPEARQAGLPVEAVGQILAENAIDLKARKSDEPARHRITIRRCRAHGFRSTRISNAAAFNIKNPVTCLLDGLKVYDNEIAFRLRKPARVTLQNSVMYNNDVALRAENLKESLTALNNTFGLNNKKIFKWIGPLPRRLNLFNNLLITKKLPALFSKDLLLRVANNIVIPSRAALYFKDAPAGDYRLRPGSPAIDNGKDVKRFNLNHDLENKKRPQGSGYDLGAFELSVQK